MNLEDIIGILGQEEYSRACREAWKDAESPCYGSNERPVFDSDLAHDAGGVIQDSDLEPIDAIDLLFCLYDKMPCYALMVYALRLFKEVGTSDRASAWAMLENRLASEHLAIRQPAAYSLWCDFFEDPGLMEEAWEALARPDGPALLLKEVLRASGPVPFKLKAELYRALLPDKNWHSAIFESLLWGLNDYFGEIDPVRAAKVLEKLSLPPDTPHLSEFRQSLENILGKNLRV